MDRYLVPVALTLGSFQVAKQRAHVETRRCDSDRATANFP